MIDHYYDKLLRASKFPIRNKYFDEETEIRRKPLIDFIFMFGRNKKYLMKILLSSLKIILIFFKNFIIYF